MEFVAVANRRREFMGINAGVIYENFYNVEQFVFPEKECLLHLRELRDEMLQAFTYGITLYGYRFPAAGELPMRGVNIEGNRHVSFLFWGYLRVCRAVIV